MMVRFSGERLSVMERDTLYSGTDPETLTIFTPTATLRTYGENLDLYRADGLPIGRVSSKLLVSMDSLFKMYINFLTV